MNRLPLGKGFPQISGKLPNTLQALCPMAEMCWP
jgi:hypothetical protein